MPSALLVDQAHEGGAHLAPQGSGGGGVGAGAGALHATVADQERDASALTVAPMADQERDVSALAMVPMAQKQGDVGALRGMGSDRARGGSASQQRCGRQRGGQVT